jgi:hypothetical protein
MGNTARTPVALRSLGSLALRERPGATPPAGRPGVRNFPRARAAAPVGECHRSVAVARWLERRAAAERAARQADERTAEEGGPRKRRRKPWAGRQVQQTPDVQHSPAAVRPEAPPVRQVPPRAHDTAPVPARRNAYVRRDHARMQPARPRPSRALAELVADAATP